MGRVTSACDARKRPMGLSIQLLGPPRMERDGAPVEPPAGHKAWGLLAYLLRTRLPPSRERLASLLFPEADDPLGALRWTLSALSAAGSATTPSSAATRSRLTLRPGTFVDVDVLERGSWMEAVALPGLGHELLDGLAFRSSPGFELWLENERRHVAGMTSAVLHQAALALLARGETRTARRGARRSSSRLNPYDENAHVLLVRCLRAAGDHEAAAAPRRVVHRALPPRAGHRAHTRAARRRRRRTRPRRACGSRGGPPSWRSSRPARRRSGAGAVEAGVQRMRERSRRRSRGRRPRARSPRRSCLSAARSSTRRAARTRKARPRCTKARRSPSRSAGSTSRRRDGARSAGCSSSARSTSERRSRCSARPSSPPAGTRSSRGST